MDSNFPINHPIDYGLKFINKSTAYIFIYSEQRSFIRMAASQWNIQIRGAIGSPSECDVPVGNYC